MNILIVSSFLPYPLFSGGHVRLYNIIKQLSKNHSIYLICEKRGQQGENEVEELRKYCKEVVVVDRKKQWSAINVLKAGFSLHPFLVIGHTNERMKQQIQNMINTKKIDVIHVETFYVCQNVPHTSIPIVLIEHNIEYMVYKRYVKTAPLVIRPLLYWDVKKLKRTEERLWNRAKVLVAVSDEERDLMNKKDVVVVPNGVDIEKFKKNDSTIKQKRILFIGDFKWIQNKKAAEWILQEIWPQFTKNSSSQYKLWIVGKRIPEYIKSMNKDGSVLFDENAPAETEKIFASSYLLVSPTVVGGGTSFKVLEAMATGVPVITTPLGIEGIKAKNNEDVIIAKSGTEFVEAMHVLITNDDLYKKLSNNARLLIEKEYSWDNIVKQLEKAYKKATLL